MLFRSLNITHCRTQLAQGRVPLVHAIPGRQESHRACQHHNHPQTAPKIFQKVDMEIHIDSSNDAIILVFNAGMRDSATVGFAISLP